ncbi:MAG: hypothetical protein KC910_29985, partial [Candidatus Eremiobacteraeota bacterium]|nr:hypothetical protein [Candidatus Eremiobacteraeota bacterium]
NLIARGQNASYVNQFAQQAQLQFQQPLLSGNGIPPASFLTQDASLAGTLWRYAQVGLAAAVPMASIAAGIIPHEYLLYPLYWAGGMGHNQHREDFQNLAIPGFELRHLTETSNVYDFMGELENHAHSSGNLIAVGPYLREINQAGKSAKHGLTEIDRAIAQKPDLVTFWAGNNDALAAALAGHVDDESLTPMEDRRWTYHSYNPLTGKRTAHQTERPVTGFRNSLVGEKGAITRLLNETSAEVVMMNIPNVTAVPFLFKVGEQIGPLPFRLILPNGYDVTDRIENYRIPSGVRSPDDGARDHFPEGTMVGMGQLLTKIINILTAKGDFDQAMEEMSQENVFTEDEVLDPGELGQIQSRVEEFNHLLAETAENPRVHLVDVNALLEQAKTTGVPLRGSGPEVVMGTTFTGLQTESGAHGFFSYDGIHPSDVGQALIANRVLDTVKAELADKPGFERFATTESIDEKAVWKTDPHRDVDHRPALILTDLQPASLFRF